jgi:transketolase
VLTVEDHFAEGGIGEAVAAALSTHAVPVYSLAVRKKPKSGETHELLDYEAISAQAVVKKVEEILNR